jgi:hypothetical protein
LFNILIKSFHLTLKDVTRKTDNEIRLVWTKKLNDKKLAAQSVVLLEKMSPCNNNYSTRSLRVEHDCKAGKNCVLK